MIQGLSHITFLVKDLRCTAALFKALFGAEEVYSSGEKQFSLSKEIFFLIGGLWVCLMEGEPLGRHAYDHVAFRVPEEELDAYAEKVRALGLKVKPGRPRIAGEGRSVYFYDFDGHLFELHAGALEARLQAYKEAESPLL